MQGKKVTPLDLLVRKSLLSNKIVKPALLELPKIIPDEVKEICAPIINTQNNISTPLNTSFNGNLNNKCLQYSNSNYPNSYFEEKSAKWNNYPNNLIDSHCHFEMLFTR